MPTLINKDRPWNEYPLGTKAHAFNGGYWIRVPLGWKWCTGATFPTPGGDAIGPCIELPPWLYTRLPDDQAHGSIVEKHQLTNKTSIVTILYDTGQDERITVLVNDAPWGPIQMNHPCMSKVDFGYPHTLASVADHVTGLSTTHWTQP